MGLNEKSETKFFQIELRLKRHSVFLFEKVNDLNINGFFEVNCFYIIYLEESFFMPDPIIYKFIYRRNFLLKICTMINKYINH